MFVAQTHAKYSATNRAPHGICPEFRAPPPEGRHTQAGTEPV